MTTIAANVLAAAAYAALGWLGLQVLPFHPVVTGIWPAAGLAVVLVHLEGRRLVPGVWIGAAVINASQDVPIAAALLIAAGNTAGAAAGAWLLTRSGLSHGFTRLADVGTLAAAAAGPTCLSAVCGVGTLVTIGSVAWSDAARLVAVWWSGDALGVLIVAPVLLLAHAGRLWPPPNRRREAVALLALLVGLTVWLFSIPLPYVYAVSPLTAILALRAGASGAVMSTLVVTLIAAVSTALQSGPFVSVSALHNLLLLQLFLGLLALKGLVLASTQTALTDSRDRLAELSRRLLFAHEQERRIIARGLHDDVGQALTAVKMGLDGIRSEVGTGAAGVRLAEQITTVEGLLRTVRDLSFELHPAVLDDLGLSSALRQHVDRMARRTGFRASLVVELGELRLPAPIEAACFRLVQEALNNVVRHARATDVTVRVVERPSGVDVMVQDDGVGFDPQQLAERPRTGIGLLGLQERAALVGGVVRVESAPAAGTRVCARFPIREGQRA